MLNFSEGLTEAFSARGWSSYVLAGASGVLLGLAWVVSPFFAFVGFLYPLFSRSTFTTWAYLRRCYVFLFAWNAVAASWMFAGYVGLGLIFVVFISFVMLLPLWLAYRMRRWSDYFFIVIWLAYEYLQYQTDILWSWLTLGNSFARLPDAIQWYEYTGTLGGSLWILVGNVLIFNAIRQYPLSKVSATQYVVVFLALWGLACGASAWLLPAPSVGKKLNVVIVQANFDISKLENNGTFDKKYANTLVRLARQKITPETDLVIFHEGIFCKSFEMSGLDHLGNYPAWDILKDFFKEYPKTSFLFGMYLHRWVQGAERYDATTYRDGGGFVKHYNAAVLYQAGKARQYHFKSKRVPLGESVPLLPHWLQPLVTSRKVDITPSERPTILRAPQARIGALVCYESTYGDYAREFTRAGAEVLCVVAEGGFWYDSTQPEAHFAIDRLRAIENRRAILRAGSIGFSGLIDASGKAHHVGKLHERTALAFSVSLGTERQTFYTRWGDWLGVLACLLAAFSFAYVRFFP